MKGSISDNSETGRSRPGIVGTLHCAARLRAEILFPNPTRTAEGGPTTAVSCQLARRALPLRELVLPGGPKRTCEPCSFNSARKVGVFRQETVAGVSGKWGIGGQRSAANIGSCQPRGWTYTNVAPWLIAICRIRSMLRYASLPSRNKKMLEVGLRPLVVLCPMFTVARIHLHRQ